MGSKSSTEQKNKRMTRSNTISGVPSPTVTPHPPLVSQNTSTTITTSATAKTPSKAEEPDKRAKSSTISSPPPKEKKDPDVFSAKRLEEVFLIYAEPDGTKIEENMSKFLADLGVEPEDVLVLVLAWRLNAKVMGAFSKEEFMTGFQAFGVDTIAKMKTIFPQLRTDINDPTKFKEIYRYAFFFSKDNEQKVLDMQTAVAMLRIVFEDKGTHVKPFLDFLNQQTGYKGMNLDQWTSFLEFEKSINGDMSNYDENSAWPVLLDEYVEWKKKN